LPLPASSGSCFAYCKWTTSRCSEEAVKSDELVEKLLNSIDSGDASVCAPFSGMNEPWPQHKIDEFDKLIADMIAE
jgi:hypothetical protein